MLDITQIVLFLGNYMSCWSANYGIPTIEQNELILSILGFIFHISRSAFDSSVLTQVSWTLMP